MEKTEFENRLCDIKERYRNGQLKREEAIEELKTFKSEIEEERRMKKEEKKELAHRIIKIILEVLLQIITMGLPALLSGGKTILTHKNK